MTNPYEPAAQIAERAANRYLMGTSAWNDFHKIAREIRALPHPPERVLPVFTAEDIGKYEHEHEYLVCRAFEGKRLDHIAERINVRIAASGFAQSELASEMVNGADRIDDKSWQYGYDRAIADTQARIDAGVRAERQACGLEMQKLQDKCPDTHSGQTMLMAYRHAENAIRARTTAAEIASDGSNSPAPCTTPLPGAAGDKDLVELLRQRVTVLEYALLDVARQARPLREWGGNVGAVMIAARKNGWEGTGK